MDRSEFRVGDVVKIKRKLFYKTFKITRVRFDSMVIVDKKNRYSILNYDDEVKLKKS